MIISFVIKWATMEAEWVLFQGSKYGGQIVTNYPVIVIVQEKDSLECAPEQG